MKNLTAVLTLTLIMMLTGCKPADVESSAEDPRLQVARDMVQAWNERDWDRMYDLFAEDGILHSVMREPMVGREVIRERLTPMTDGIEQIELKLRNIGMVGDVVVLERVDDFVYNGRRGQVPVVGVMEIADGKVTEWREYYDHESLVEAMSPEPRIEEEILAESEARIRALLEKLQSDWNGGDMAAYLDAYRNSDDMSLMYGQTAVRGWQSVSDLFNGNWTTEEAMGDFAVAEVEVRFAGPDVAIVSGTFEHQFPEEKIVGAFSHVLHRTDEAGWEIIHEHTSRGPGEE